MHVDLAKLVASLPTVAPSRKVLVRFVAEASLKKYLPWDYLYTSGYAGRVNPANVKGLYASEDASTAGSEFDRQQARNPDPTPPVQKLFAIEIDLPVIDLGDTAVRAALKLTPAHLAETWRLVSTPTRLQFLGQVVSQQRRFGAIRFPSDAAQSRGFAGYNFVLFPNAVASPMSVAVKDGATELQRW